jgi:hypothetical protein
MKEKQLRDKHKKECKTVCLGEMWVHYRFVLRAHEPGCHGGALFASHAARSENE